MRRNGPKAQGFRRGQEHRIAALGQLIEYPQALLFPAPGHGAAQQTKLTGGQYRRRFPQKAGELLGHAGSGQIVLADHQYLPPGVLMERGSHMGPVNGTQTGDGAGNIMLRMFLQSLILRQSLEQCIEKMHRSLLPSKAHKGCNRFGCSLRVTYD